MASFNLQTWAMFDHFHELYTVHCTQKHTHRYIHLETNFVSTWLEIGLMRRYNEAKLMTKLAPEWVRTSDPVSSVCSDYRLFCTQ